MRSIECSSATGAPSILLQADRVRRRIAASDSVASLVAALAYGEPRRADHVALASLTASRVAAAAVGAR